MSPTEQFAVIDLDGTLCRRNTLHLYLTTALKYHLAHGNLSKVFRIGVQYLMRGLRLTGHSSLKFKALKAAGTEKALLEIFSEQAKNSFNPAVVELIDSLKEKGYSVILATAAPEGYVHSIWDGVLVATTWPHEDKPVECRGEEKLRRVKEIAGSVDLVVTDHYDDLPLMKASREVLLVNPSAKTLKEIEKARLPYTILSK